MPQSSDYVRFTGVKKLPPDFSEILKFLNDEGVEYLLIGGYAVGIHGYVRATGDMDVWIAVSERNATGVTAALARFGFARGEVEPALFLEAKDTPQILVSKRHAPEIQFFLRKIWGHRDGDEGFGIARIVSAVTV